MPLPRLAAQARLLPLALVLTGQPAHANVCRIDIAAVETAIQRLEPAYGILLSDISCDAPDLPAHLLMCGGDRPDDTLWRMGRLDDLAWVHAYENATGTEVDLANPPRDDGFLAARDACTDAACLCALLIDHTNGSLGGPSPYPQ